MNFFHFTQFSSSMLIEQVIALRKVRIDNLKFRTGLKTWLNHLTDILCSMGLHVEIYSLWTFFNQCSSSRSLPTETWKVRTWNLAQIFKIKTFLRLMPRAGRLLKESLNLKSKLHGIQTLLFICNSFGCKLQLQFIQHHTRDCFKAFAWCPLKWLCCFKSDQTPFARAGCGFRSAALQRIQFGTHWLVFVPHDLEIERSNEHSFDV